MSYIFIILLRFILGGDGIIYYAAAGANLGAGAAAGALFGIDTGIAVFHGDGAVFAFLHAASAAYARLHAGGAGNAAYVLIAAEHKDLRLRGDYPYGAAGAGLFAVAAGNANIGVYAGDAVVHAYCAEAANAHTIAQAYARICAFLRAARHGCGGGAAGVSVVFIPFLSHAVVTLAYYAGNHLFAFFNGNAQRFAYGCHISRGAGIRLRFAADYCFRQRGTARVAAGAAVCAAQSFAHFGYPRVHLNGQLFIRNFKQYAEYQSYNAKHAQCKYYRDPIHFVPSLRAKAREAHERHGHQAGNYQ